MRIVAASLIVASLWMLARAWVGDDALITFRVVENFVHGYGLRWNIAERVQVFTHPLWMLLHIPIYAVFGNLFLGTIGLSVACCTGALWISWRTWGNDPLTFATLTVLPLMAASAFLDYTTSGLENPLSFLLFACFGWVAIRGRDHPKFWLHLSLVVALAGLTRLDTLLIYAPVMLYLAATRRDLRMRQAILGFLPLIAWMAFSLVYYGFVFPNTKYAKLNTGIETLDYAVQGFRYLISLYAFDALSAALLLASAGAGVAIFCRLRAAGWLAVGVWLYMLYIICIGGDFMSGRFWSLPIFAGCWMLVGLIPKLPARKIAIFCACILAMKWVSVDMYHSWQTCEEKLYGQCLLYGVADEWRFYERSHLLRGNGTLRKAADSPFSESVAALSALEGNVYIAGGAGIAGIRLGPQAHIIDPYALTDPLLARLPVPDPKQWRIGHFIREIPQGYVHAVATGDTGRMEPELAALYAKLRLITQGDIWNMERLRAIMEMNL